MKIVVLGANGRTGRLVINRALETGHDVTAVTRSAESIGGFEREHLSIRVGNVCEPDFLKVAFANQDAVISTLGPRMPTISACMIYKESALAINEAMQATGLRRVLVTSTALLFSPISYAHRLFRLIARNNCKAAARMESHIQDSNCDWTLVRVGFLQDDQDNNYRKSVGAMPVGGNSVSRAAVAEFLVDELRRSEHVREVVGLSGGTKKSHLHLQ